MYMCNNCGQDMADHHDKCPYCKSNDISSTQWGFTDEREDTGSREFDYDVDVMD